MLRKGGGRLVYIEGGWIWRLQFFLPQPKNFTKPKFSSQPKILGGGCGRRVVDVEGRVVDVEGGWWMWRESGGCTTLYMILH